MKNEILRIKKIIDSIENVLHYNTCLNIIENFHVKYGRLAHENAHELYGYAEAVLKHKKSPE